ncbi:hypothetical protein EJB05_14335, partial [Eragrostis curvula]
LRRRLGSPDLHGHDGEGSLGREGRETSPRRAAPRLVLGATPRLGEDAPPCPWGRWGRAAPSLGGRRAVLGWVPREGSLPREGREREPPHSGRERERLDKGVSRENGGGGGGEVLEKQNKQRPGNDAVHTPSTNPSPPAIGITRNRRKEKPVLGGSSKLHLSWLWRAPRRALCAARDFYVRSLTGCAGHIPGDAAFGYPTFGAAPYGGEFSFASSSRRSSSADVDDDLRELIRAASQRRAAEAAAAAAAAAPPVPRSQSVAMARIDEDRPCEFGDAAAGATFLPRSQSCAVGAGRLAGRRGRVAALAA